MEWNSRATARRYFPGRVITTIPPPTLSPSRVSILAGNQPDFLPSVSPVFAFRNTFPLCSLPPRPPSNFVTGKRDRDRRVHEREN